MYSFTIVGKAQKSDDERIETARRSFGYEGVGVIVISADDGEGGTTPQEVHTFLSANSLLADAGLPAGTDLRNAGEKLLALRNNPPPVVAFEPMTLGQSADFQLDIIQGLAAILDGGSSEQLHATLVQHGRETIDDVPLALRATVSTAVEDGLAGKIKT